MRNIFCLLSFILFSLCKNETATKIDLEPALSLLINNIAQDPDNDSLYYARAQWYYQQNSFESAISDLTYAIKLDSLVPVYYHLLADALLDNNQSFEALNSMKRAAAIFPTRIQTLLKLAEYQNILKQNDESISTSLQILAIDPLNAEAYLMAGINYRDMKDTVNAILSLQKATTYDDRLVDGWLLLAKLNSTRNYKYAEQCLTNGYKIDSMSIPTLHTIADFYQEKNPLQAIYYYEKIVSLDPSYVAANINSGIVYFSIDSFAKALDQFNIACERDPTNALYYYHRGTVKEAMNDNKGASSDYQMAVNLNPKNQNYVNALNQLKN